MTKKKVPKRIKETRHVKRLERKLYRGFLKHYCDTEKLRGGPGFGVLKLGIERQTGRSSRAKEGKPKKMNFGLRDFSNREEQNRREFSMREI